MSLRPSRSQGKHRPRHNRRRPQHARQQAPAPTRVERKPSPNAIEVSELESVFASVDDVLQRALADMGFRTPTPIQDQSIPDLLEGKDMIGIAQTGTGKTAAFGLPLLQRLAREETPARSQRPKALILAPTRELAAQIDDTLQDCSRFTTLRHACIFGGVGQGPQVSGLRRGVEVLVATPGRLLDLMNQRELFLDDVEVFVLDEADRMLDMGFLPDIKRVMAALPKKRQSLLFSATMPESIRMLSNKILWQPVEVSIEPEKPTIEAIDQHVRFVDKASKIKALKDILECDSMHRVIVFTRMKHVANRVAEGLSKTGITAAAIHGNKSQAARTRALDGFRAGKVRVLVATDIAARGIDVPNVSHVVNFDLPEEAETYVHRIGRTARAGAQGHAVSFCAADERGYLHGIERLIRKDIPVHTDHKFHSDSAQRATGSAAKPAPRGGGRPRRDGRGGGGGGRSRGAPQGRNGRPARRSGAVRSRRSGARAS